MAVEMRASAMGALVALLKLRLKAEELVPEAEAKVALATVPFKMISRAPIGGT